MTDDPHKFQGVNQLTLVKVVPCDITPWVYAECLFYALLRAIWSLVSPSPKEVIKLATEGSWLHNLRILFEEAEIEEPTFAAGGLRFLFEVAEWADLLVWWLFLVGVGIEFVADWTSAVYQITGCEEHPTLAEGWSKDGNGFCNGTGAWFDGPAWQNCGGNLGTIWGSTMFIPPGTLGSWLIATQWQAIGGGVIPVETQIIDADSREVLDFLPYNPEQTDIGKSSISRVFQLPGGATGRTLLAQSRCAIVSPVVAIIPSKSHSYREIRSAPL